MAGVLGGRRRRRNTAGVWFRGGGLARDAQTGAPGVNPTRAWVGEQRRGTCSPPVHTGQGIRARVGPAAARGGSGSPANCVNAVPALIRVGFSCWGFYTVRPNYIGFSSGLRHSKAKPGHGAVAAQRQRPVTGHLGDLQTTGACTKRKRGPGDTLARLGSGRCVMQKCRWRGRVVARWRRSNGVRGEGAAMELRASGPPGSTPGRTRILLRWLWWAGGWWNSGSAPAQGHGVAEHGGAGWRRR